MFRRFGTLRSKLIIHLQYELAKLEETLYDMDKLDHETEKKWRITSIKDDKGDEESKRTALLEEIDRKLKHYGNRSLCSQKTLSVFYSLII